MIKIVYVNEHGYLERKEHGGRIKKGSNASKRSWFLPKFDHDNLVIILGKGSRISISKKYLGKRVRFKIEVLK